MNTQRTIIIGDVHGMAIELDALLAKLDVTTQDEIVFVGDLVDKGEDSPAVVRRVRELAETHNVVVVEGNHEDKHRRFRRNAEQRPEVAAGMVERTPELQTITEGMSDEDIAFLNAAVPFHRVPAHDLLVVHAGIPGDMTEFPESLEAAQALGGKAKKKFQLVMRTRFVDAETGKFLQLGKETEADPFWADVFDGRFGHVVFGHQPFMDGPGQFPHATGVDTGAVFGGELTALVVDASGDRSFVSVASRKFAEEGIH